MANSLTCHFAFLFGDARAQSNTGGASVGWDDFVDPDVGSPKIMHFS